MTDPLPLRAMADRLLLVAAKVGFAGMPDESDELQAIEIALLAWANEKAEMERQLGAVIKLVREFEAIPAVRQAVGDNHKPSQALCGCPACRLSIFLARDSASLPLAAKGENGAPDAHPISADRK